MGAVAITVPRATKLPSHPPPPTSAQGISTSPTFRHLTVTTRRVWPHEATPHPGTRGHATPPASVEGAALSDHPDTQFIASIIDGMEHGFLIGFQQPGPLRMAVSNCPSAEADPQVVADYIRKEVTLRRFLGPFTHESVPAGTHLGKFGVIPKGHTPGKWCLITDLSSQKV